MVQKGLSTIIDLNLDLVVFDVYVFYSVILNTIK